MFSLENILGSGLIAALTAAIVSILTNLISAKIRNRELDIQMLHIALGILREDPEKDDDVFRTWAVEIFKKYSDVKVDSNMEKKLLKQKLPTIYATTSFNPDMWKSKSTKKTMFYSE